MPKDTKTLGNNKARAWESLGFAHKKRLCQHFDTTSSIKDAPYFPNNKHDAWIDAVLIDNLKEKTRYVKVAFDALENVYMDEIFVNPSIR